MTDNAAVLYHGHADEMAEVLDAHPDYRVLRRFVPARDLPWSDARSPANDPPRHVGVFVDVETTGLDPKEDKIIELAVVRFEYTGHGELYRVLLDYEQLEHPGRPIPPEITKLTGISDESVVHQAIDDDTVFNLVKDAELVLAHNAAFDRPFFERRFPALAGKPWACSYRDIDWTAHGQRHATVEDLLRDVCGQFTDHHRAAMDAYAALRVLQCFVPVGETDEGNRGTYLAELVRASGTPTTRLLAWGAPFAFKDELKRRAYRWEPSKRVWYRDLATGSEALAAEAAWLGRVVHGASSITFNARDRYSERI